MNSNQLMSRINPIIIGCLLMLVLTANVLAFAQLQPLSDKFELKIENELVTLQADNASVSELVRAIAEHVGIEVHLEGEPTDLVTVVFVKQPVADVLKELVKNTNHAIVYARLTEGHENLRIDQLWLYDESNATNQVVIYAPEGQANPDDLIRSRELVRRANKVSKPQALESLTQALQNDPAPLVRSRAAIALGTLNDSRVVPVLKMALDDEHMTVRMQATNALGQIGGESAAMILGELLMRSTDSTLRIVAAMGLQNIGSESAKSYLHATAQDPDKQVRNAIKKQLNRGQQYNKTTLSRTERLGSEYAW